MGGKNVGAVNELKGNTMKLVVILGAIKESVSFGAGGDGKPSEAVALYRSALAVDSDADLDTTLEDLGDGETTSRGCPVVATFRADACRARRTRVSR